MPQTHIHCYVVGVAGVVVINRPSALNALNNGMVWLLFDIFNRWKHDSSIGHVIICSSNSKSFCAGGDIVEASKSILAGHLVAADRFFQGEYLVDLAIAEFGKPIIALCDGLVMGGGAGISQHSSHIVMTETTQFAMPESCIGFFPDVGASYFLRSCPIPVARLLGMTGFVADGATCATLGLANYLVPSKEIETLKNALMSCETDQIDRVIISHQVDLGLSKLSQNIESINYIFDSDLKPEHMQNRALELHSMRPSDQFVKDVVVAFAFRCPYSMKLFWRLLQFAERFSSPEEAITFDYHLALWMIRRPDFVEGVRAQLVDKDKVPKWIPDSLEMVDEDLLEEVFKKVNLPRLR